MRRKEATAMSGISLRLEGMISAWIEDYKDFEGSKSSEYVPVAGIPQRLVIRRVP